MTYLALPKKAGKLDFFVSISPNFLFPLVFSQKTLLFQVSTNPNWTKTIRDRGIRPRDQSEEKI